VGGCEWKGVRPAYVFLGVWVWDCKCAAVCIFGQACLGKGEGVRRVCEDWYSGNVWDISLGSGWGRHLMYFLGGGPCD